jgi:hypothetical protein
MERSPLKDHENRSILKEYNRLTAVDIPLSEFTRWLQDSPAGPAWHAILETDEGRIVGHTSAFPFQVNHGSPALVPAKSEYSYLHEDFRSAKIRGLEHISRPAFIILIDQLFQHCLAQGWGPIFASTNERNQVFTRKVGLRALEFPLTECLFLLRPKRAARHTPNLESHQRLALFAAGLAQRTAWSIASLVLPNSNGTHSIPISNSDLEKNPERLAFFEDAASLHWRYLEDQYIRFAVKGTPGDHLIVKRGSESRYLRVCQWRLSKAPSYFSLITSLVRQAQSQNAMGLRWAVYDDAPSAAALVSQMRKMGFLCARRTRIVMIHKSHPQFQTREVWNMNDSLFSFDP